MLRYLFRLFFVLLLICCAPPVEAADAPALPPAAPIFESSPEESPPEPISYQAAFVKMILTLVALIFLIFLSVWMLRRIARGRLKQHNYGRGIKILERRPLSAKSLLYLIEVNGKKIVIAESQLEVRPIATVDDFTSLPQED